MKNITSISYDYLRGLCKWMNICNHGSFRLDYFGHIAATEEHRRNYRNRNFTEQEKNEMVLLLRSA